MVQLKQRLQVSRQPITEKVALGPRHLQPIGDGQATHQVAQPYFGAGVEPGMENQALNGGSFYDYYRTRDGRWLSVGSLEPQFMQQFCAAIGRPELAALGLSPKDQKALKREIEIEIEKHDLAEWQRRFAALDACVEPMLELAEAIEHPQLQARQLVWPDLRQTLRASARHYRDSRSQAAQCSDTGSRHGRMRDPDAATDSPHERFDPTA